MRSGIFLACAVLAVLSLLAILRFQPGRGSDVSRTVIAPLDGSPDAAGRSVSADSSPEAVVLPEEEIARLSMAEASTVGLGRIELTFPRAPHVAPKSGRRLGQVLLSRFDDEDFVQGASVFSGRPSEFERLSEGAYRVEAGVHARFRFEPFVIELGPGEVVEREVIAQFRRRVEFTVAASLGSASGASSGTGGGMCEVAALEGKFTGGSRFTRSTTRQVRMPGAVKIELDVFPGPIVWEGRYRGKRGRPVVPALIAQAEVHVPPVSPGAEEVLLSEPLRDTVEVSLTFAQRSGVVGVKGVLLNAPGERSGGIEVVGESRTGEPFAEVLAIRNDGGFFFSVERARLAGPQIFLRSERHQDLLGPFIPGHELTDLGQLRFADRLTQAQEDARREELEKAMAKQASGSTPHDTRPITSFFKR